MAFGSPFFAIVSIFTSKKKSSDEVLITVSAKVVELKVKDKTIENKRLFDAL